MTSKVDAVIAALKVALAEAERSRDTYWSSRDANRWIDQLPGAWWGRWRNLKLRKKYGGYEDVNRTEYISQVKATLAYLEANRKQVSSSTSWFSRAKQASANPSEPIDAEFQEVARNVHSLPVPPPNKRNR